MNTKKIKTIGLIAPSGNIKDPETVNKNIEILEKHFKVKKFYNENTAFNYLADSDTNRAGFFEQAFLDNETDLILAIRGGYGAIRIVDKINYEKLKTCNKFFLGSSDLTILLISMFKKTNVKCFHSLMVTNGFVDNLDKNIEIVENSSFNLNLETIKKGSSEGILWGGNLSSLVSILSGETYLPNEDIVLFLEDLNEPMYKLDKMFYEIFRCEKLRSKIKGIIFGDFYFEKNEILPLLKSYADLFKVPAFLTDEITHKKNNVTLPFGKKISL